MRNREIESERGRERGRERERRGGVGGEKNTQMEVLGFHFL